MRARLRNLIAILAETFWIVPAAMILGGILLALGLLRLDRSGVVPDWLIQEAWLYNGGGTGARTLLGAVASSTIGVAGTVFSITIAALSLAAGQMGPRLLRNFTKDRGNQVTLGIFLGTFSYSLMVLREVRTQSEGPFVPNVSLSFSIILAFVCVATLVFFVSHMSGRINVDTVIELVSHDITIALNRLTTDEPGPIPPPASVWRDAVPVPNRRRGYLQQLDDEGLATWAAEHGTVVRLLVRPGDHVFPGAPIALATCDVDGIEDAIEVAMALGGQRVSSMDIEFAMRQLVEVAVRALSPGINDPHTAISVLDQLGTALCEMVSRYLPAGVKVRDGRAVLVVPRIDYAGLTDTMFHMIRQNAGRSPAVLIRMLEVLTVVASCEHDPERVKSLRRHADLILADAERGDIAPADLKDIRNRHRGFQTMTEKGPAASVSNAAS